MSFKFSLFARNLVKATSFWKDNYLILREIRYFYWIAIAAIFFPIIAATLEGFGISFLLGFLQNLIDPSGEPFKTGIQWFDIQILGIKKSELERLYRISTLILVSTWLRVFFNYLSAVYMRMAQVKLIDRLYKSIFEQLQSLNLKFFSSVRSGEIINTLTSEVAQLQQAVGSLSLILSKGATLVIYTLISLWISWALSIIAILLFSLATVGLSNLNRQVRAASFPVSRARGKFTSLASEFIGGIRTVMAFATQDYERQRYYQASSEIVKTATVAVKRLAIIRPLSEGIATSILIAMIIVSMTFFVPSGELQVSSLLTFLFILFRLIPSIQEINNSVAQISSFQGSVDNIQNLLKKQDKPYLKNGDRLFTQFNESIQFVKVSFGYDSQSFVLQNINIRIERGTTVALVGASGAGKSTLVDLIPRFYDPTDGQVLVDGIDLRKFDINSVRRKMAIVSQDTFIFNSTIRANIAYGLEDISDIDICRAAHLANAFEFIQNLPEGFDTLLGDRGVRLSGGQRQRIAIARALLRNPEILILDEATSALDSVSEKLIQESLEKLAVGRTVIAIAHRLSTIMGADKVIVLEQGRIVEQGTYQELLAQQGKLWKYHQMQHKFHQTK
jgi:ABC-type multidrug transport system fused ATPase/permease subunit